MAVPKLAKWSAAYTSIAADSITNAMMDDDSVGPDQIIDGDDYIFGTVEAAGKVIGLPIVSDIQTHTGVALADLTAAFGAPATLDNGSIMTYVNSTDGKVYLVTVAASVFYITAFMTAVSA